MTGRGQSASASEGDRPADQSAARDKGPSRHAPAPSAPSFRWTLGRLAVVNMAVWLFVVGCVYLFRLLLFNEYVIGLFGFFWAVAFTAVTLFDFIHERRA